MNKVFVSGFTLLTALAGLITHIGNTEPISKSDAAPVHYARAMKLIDQRIAEAAAAKKRSVRSGSVHSSSSSSSHSRSSYSGGK